MPSRLPSGEITNRPHTFNKPAFQLWTSIHAQVQLGVEFMMLPWFVSEEVEKWHVMGTGNK